MRRGPAVVHVVTRDQRRGAEAAAVSLDQALRARGWRTELVALAPGANAPSAGLDTLGSRTLAVGTLAALRRETRHADVVVAHGSRTLPACALALPRGKPWVYVNIGDPRAWMTTPGRRLRSRILLRRPRRIVAITQRSLDALVALGLTRPEAVSVIPNFRSAARFRQMGPDDHATVRAQWGIPPTAPFVGWVGSLSSEKRPDLAVAAVGAMPEAHLVVVGDGPLGSRLRAETEAAGLSGRIHFAGASDEPERVLGAMDALLLTSDTEGVPGVLIEAGLCGVPAAATKVGYVDEVVREGTTGRLAPPGDADRLAKALRDVLDHRDAYGAAAREWCLARFDEGVVVPRWEALLASVASGSA